MAAPILTKPIPSQVINEQAAFAPFDLKKFIEVEPGSGMHFQAEVSSGAALPQGMICTSDGVLTGIPAKGTQGNYPVIVTATNESGALQAEFLLVIKPSLATTESHDAIKTQIWEALQHNLPIPDIDEISDRPPTLADIYYLLERWATLIIWDAFNLEPAGPKVELTLPGASSHYRIYDRGSSLIAAPLDLYSHERTLEDALQTARAMAREVYKRGWTIEIAGFEKMVRAVWVEVQHLSDKYGKDLEILNFDPGFKEIRIYNDQAIQLSKLRKDI